jgi:hypothetical protein
MVELSMATVNQQAPVHMNGWMVGDWENCSTGFQFLCGVGTLLDDILHSINI